MPSYSKNDVILVRYPFSDLSATKVRPAVVLHAPHPSQDYLIVPLTSKTSTLAAAFVIARRGRRFSERLPKQHHLLPSKSAYAKDTKVKHVWSHWSKVILSTKCTPRHKYFTARLNRTHSCYVFLSDRLRCR